MHGACVTQLWCSWLQLGFLVARFQICDTGRFSTKVNQIGCYDCSAYPTVDCANGQWSVLSEVLLSFRSGCPSVRSRRFVLLLALQAQPCRQLGQRICQGSCRLLVPARPLLEKRTGEYLPVSRSGLVWSLTGCWFAA